MNNQSVTITKCANGYQLLVESGEDYTSELFIATIIEQQPYSMLRGGVAIADILKQIFETPVKEYDPLSDRPESV
jgi:hypothetical protein